MEQKLRRDRNMGDNLRRLSWREPNHATPKRAKFPSVFASSLAIRQYSGVPRLRRNDNFAPLWFKEVCAAAFFQSARCEFAGRLTPFKNEHKTDGKRRRAKP